MRDATYSAMRADKFVVVHHLRNQAAFNAAHNEALAQKTWRPNLRPCVPWDAAEASDDSGQLAIGRATQLRNALRAFDCCHHWQLCEIFP